MAEKFNVGVVETGYAGLVTGVCLAHVGHRVTLVDKDSRRIEQLERGRIPIFEPILEELAARNSRRLSFATELPEVVRGADFVFIGVDAPPEENGSADLSNVPAVARDIGRALAEADLNLSLVVVNKSTVPIGSGDYDAPILNRRAWVEVPA